MLAELFDMKILQKSHHLFPWLTQNCTMRKIRNNHIYKTLISSKESKHQHNYPRFRNLTPEEKEKETNYSKVTG